MSIVELMAAAIVAAEGQGHNDPPLYDLLEPDSQARYRDMADFIIKALAEHRIYVLPR